MSWYITTSMFITTSNPAHGTGLISPQPLLLSVSRAECWDAIRSYRLIACKRSSTPDSDGVKGPTKPLLLEKEPRKPLKKWKLEKRQ